MLEQDSLFLHLHHCQCDIHRDREEERRRDREKEGRRKREGQKDILREGEGREGGIERRRDGGKEKSGDGFNTVAESETVVVIVSTMN